MEQQALYTEQQMPKAAPVRAALRSARDILKRGELLLHMTLCTLFVLLALVSVYFFSALCGNLLEDYTLLDLFQVDLIYTVVLCLGAYLLVTPLLLGRLRLAGLCVCEGQALPGELFYYFTSPARYFRSMWIGFLYMLCFALPCVLFAIGLLLSFGLYVGVFDAWLSPIAALLGLVGCLLLVCIICAGFLLLSGALLPVVVLAVGDERNSFGRAMCDGVRVFRHSFCVLLRYMLLSLLKFVACLGTLGLAWLLYYAHQTTVGFWQLMTELKQK